MSPNEWFAIVDRLTSMQAFAKTVELGSLTAAATAMGTSPQMVGKHVGALEERLGVQLLRRTTRRQSLTETGQAFYERCRVILAETEAAEALARDLGARPRGRLRIGAPVNYGAIKVAPLVTRFLRDFPEVQVELSLSDRYVDVVDEGYDAVFRLGPLVNSALVSRRLESHRQIACASPAYLAARGIPIHPEDLAAHDCLGYVNWSGRPYAEWVFTKDGRSRAVTIASRLQVNDGRVLVAAAVDGHGVILQPAAVVENAIGRGRLRPVLEDYQAPERTLHLLFAAGRPMAPKLRAFVDRVASELGPRSRDEPCPSGRSPART